MDEGYTKFQCLHKKAAWKDIFDKKEAGLFENELARLTTLDRLRSELHKAHLIGVYDNGISYGNLSIRSYIERARLEKQHGAITKDLVREHKDLLDRFIISSTSTGSKKKLGVDGYCLVPAVDVEKNTVWSVGSLPASAEAMTHAAVYSASSAVNCVVHIHSKHLFDALLKRKDTVKTPKKIPYGTPEMAHAIGQLAKKHNLKACVAMAGHDEGILFYGESIAEVKDLIHTTVGLFAE